MFGHRNYSGYSFNAKPTEEFLSLSDSVKVNKLKGSQLSVYFNVLKNESHSKQEIIKRNNHFEEFKKTCLTKQAAKLAKEDKVVKNKKGTVGEILKQFGMKSPRVYHKSAFRRAPLRKIKTVGIEIPASYKAEAIYMPPKKKEVAEFINITQSIRKSKPKVQIQEVPEIKEVEKIEEIEEEPKRSSKSTIEKQLQITREEIDTANLQLAQIQSLLNSRKASLSPVREEEEEVEEKTRLVKQLVDKKCSPILPRTQWTVKSLDDDRRSKSRKNKLMVTLTSLNQHLQRIQEKYFSEPKIKYKSVSDFVPPRTKPALETLFKNESETVSSDTADYIQDLIKRTEKLTRINKPNNQPNHKVETNDSILVLMPPKQENHFDDSPAHAKGEECGELNKTTKGILKNKISSTDGFDTVLEAPILQESICKSNYLMKEFNLTSNNKNFDLSALLLHDRDDSSSSECFKKNVRFSQSSRKNFSSNETQLLPGIEIALKNSLFYCDEQEFVK
ncbi:hypothetical protein Trydic_g6173 [Trypoxylus dichotomus]